MSETKKARQLHRGDIIRYTSGDTEVEEVIREVVMVLRMANGESVSVSPTDTFDLVDPEPETDSPSITGDNDV